MYALMFYPAVFHIFELYNITTSKYAQVQQYNNLKNLVCIKFSAGHPHFQT